MYVPPVLGSAHTPSKELNDVREKCCSPRLTQKHNPVQVFQTRKAGTGVQTFLWAGRDGSRSLYGHLRCVLCYAVIVEVSLVRVKPSCLEYNGALELRALGVKY